MESSLIAEGSKVIPVLVGGLLAVAGGVGSQILIHFLSGKREQAKLRRDRLESLVKAVFSHSQWIDNKYTKMVFRNEDHDDLNPIDEARMLQSLHFPELANELRAVQRSYMPLLEFINSQRIAHMKDKQQFIANWNPTPFNDAYKTYISVVHEFTEKARTLLVKQ